MKIGITGAAGFLGANVVKYYYEVISQTETSVEIVPFYSSTIHNPLTDAYPLSYIHLDICNRAEVFQKTKGLDALFHIAGSVDFRKKFRRKTWDINVIGTKNVFDAALENNVQQLVYISSINVLGEGKNDLAFVDETTSVYNNLGLNPNSFTSETDTLSAVSDSLRNDYRFLRRIRVPYFDAKLAGYELARNYYLKKGLPVVIVLPGTIVGAGDIHNSISQLIFSVYKNHLPFTLAGGTSFVSAFDAGKGLWLALKRGKTGQAYIISGNETDNLRYNEFMQLVADVVKETYGKWCMHDFFPLPPKLANPLSRVIERINGSSSLNYGLALAGSRVHRYSIKKAQSELGYAPTCDLPIAIRENLEFILSFDKQSNVHQPSIPSLLYPD